MKERTLQFDAAQRVRELVSARDAAEHYGFTPNRAGYICCPFHGERTPSLKLYPDGGWHCFGCHKGGSCIDFAMALFGLDFRQAVVRLDMDFSLNLVCNAAAPPPTRSAILEARQRERARRAALEAEEKSLIDEHRRLHQNRQLYAPDRPGIEALHPLFVEALKRLPEVQYRLEELEIELRRLDHGRNAAGPEA